MFDSKSDMNRMVLIAFPIKIGTKTGKENRWGYYFYELKNKEKKYELLE